MLCVYIDMSAAQHPNIGSHPLISLVLTAWPQTTMYSIFGWGDIFCFHLGGGRGEPEKKFRYFWGGGGPKKNGNFQIFTHPLLINNERFTIVYTLIRFV